MKRSAPALLLALLAACSPAKVNNTIFNNELVNEASVSDVTRSGYILSQLPEPSEKVPLSVYEFQDQTGQFKPSDNIAEYSSAVTKGGLAVLTKALLDSGNHKWFRVTERGGLRNLLQERQIVRTMRTEYAGPNGAKLPDLPPLVYGGLLLEGGIIFYDSNVITGGIGAAYFGIDGSVQYHRDMVSVYLRATSVQTGEVLLSVTSSKTIFSSAISAGLSRYLSFDKLLQAEAGVTANEPGQLAVRQAIETAVYAMIMEGAINKLWSFKDPSEGQKAIEAYLQRRDGNKDAADAVFNPIKQAAVADSNTTMTSSEKEWTGAPTRSRR